jgi:hypothetical protein
MLSNYEKFELSANVVGASHLEVENSNNMARTMTQSLLTRERKGVLIRF